MKHKTILITVGLIGLIVLLLPFCFLTLQWDKLVGPQAQLNIYFNVDIADVCGNGVLQPANGEQCDDGNTVNDGNGCSATCTLLDCGNSVCEPAKSENMVSCPVDCSTPVCGNNVPELLGGEQCDDGCLNAGLGCQGGPAPAGDDWDGCSSVCLIEANMCGDGMCDRSYPENVFSCNADCNQVCGDGYVDSPEQCDDSADGDNFDSCTDSCLIPTTHCGNFACERGAPWFETPSVCSSDCNLICGDGYIDNPEQCDDGNTVNDGNGCSATCTLLDCGNSVCEPALSENMVSCPVDCSTPVCGNSVREPGEACDRGPSGDLTCSSSCNVLPYCNDGMCNNGENFNTCPVDCSTPVCGNSVVEGSEQCDGVSPVDGVCVGCIAVCDVPPASALIHVWDGSACVLSTPVCGNGLVESGEACDDNNLQDLDGCNNVCQVEFCGDNICQPIDNNCFADCKGVCGNSVCEAGEYATALSCLVDCDPVCGNSVVESESPFVSESCDDGNIVSGDGCDGSCLIEVPTPSGGGGGFQGEIKCADWPYSSCEGRGGNVSGIPAGPVCALPDMNLIYILLAILIIVVIIGRKRIFADFKNIVSVGRR